MDEAAAYPVESENTSVQTSSSQQDRNLPVREIHKNGWLKRYPFSEKKSSIFSKQIKVEPQWVVFCIHNDREAFLELYESRRGACSHKPMTIIPLAKCLHLSPSLIMQDNQYIFTVTLDATAIKFAAASREQMNDWIDTIKNKIIDLGILKKQENIYSEEPVQLRKPKKSIVPQQSLVMPNTGEHVAVRRTLSSDGREAQSSDASSRDPASPLPLVPSPVTRSPLTTPEVQITTQQTESTASESLYATPSTSESSQGSNITVIQVDNLPSVFNFDNLVVDSDSSTPVTPQSAPVTQSRIYDTVFNSELQVQNPAYENHELQQGRRHSESETTDSASTLTSSMIPESAARANQSGNASAQAEQSRPLTLKEQQVLKLQHEIAHRGGIRINLRKRDCQNGIAFVECFGAVWVAGWKQREHPFLHNTFHIGDHIVSIAGQPVRSLQEATKLIKRQILQVELILRRVPLGVVIAIKREYEGQDLGIVREGNTAEIKEVIRGGLAARYGLPLHAQSCEDSTHSCKWALTEINNRPLNMFFKDAEVESRLNAVGRDISILVQPLDLVKTLKKQLKSMRNFKDYIVQ